MSIITYGLDPTINSKLVTLGYGLEISVEVIITEIPHVGGGRTFRPKRKKITMKFRAPGEEDYQFVSFFEDEDEDLMEKDELKLLFTNVRSKEDLKIFIVDNIKKKPNGFKFTIKDGEFK
jgi:hypothetical protein